MSLFFIFLFSSLILYYLLLYSFFGLNKFNRVQNKPKTLINPSMQRQFENEEVNECG